jgi:hypothetical protein
MILEYAKQLTIIAEIGIPKVDVPNAILDIKLIMELVLFKLLILLIIVEAIHYAKNGIKINAKNVVIELIVIIKIYALKLIIIAILMINLMDYA